MKKTILALAFMMISLVLNAQHSETAAQQANREIKRQRSEAIEKQNSSSNGKQSSGFSVSYDANDVARREKEEANTIHKKYLGSYLAVVNKAFKKPDSLAKYGLFNECLMELDKLQLSDYTGAIPDRYTSVVVTPIFDILYTKSYDLNKSEGYYFTDDPSYSCNRLIKNWIIAYRAGNTEKQDYFQKQLYKLSTLEKVGFGAKNKFGTIVNDDILKNSIIPSIERVREDLYQEALWYSSYRYKAGEAKPLSKTTIDKLLNTLAFSVSTRLKELKQETIRKNKIVTYYSTDSDGYLSFLKGTDFIVLKRIYSSKSIQLIGASYEKEEDLAYLNLKWVYGNYKEKTIALTNKFFFGTLKDISIYDDLAEMLILEVTNNNVDDFEKKVFIEGKRTGKYIGSLRLTPTSNEVVEYQIAIVRK